MLEELGKLQGDSVRARMRRTDISVHKIFHAHRQKGGILSHLWWVSLLYVYIPLLGALIISAQIKMPRYAAN